MTDFAPMLASPADLSNLQFPMWASPKLDGIRCVIDELGHPVTRSLKPIPNHYVRGLLSNLNLIGLDGELCVGAYNTPGLMQRTTSGVMKQTGEPDFVYYVFDLWVCPKDGFDKRIEMLNRAFDNVGWAPNLRKHMKLLPQARVNSLEEVQKFELIALEQGFEGVMLRKFDSPYKYGRSTTKQQWLLKMKRMEDGEAVVIGFEEGVTNTNPLEQDNLGHAKRSTAKEGMIPNGRLGAFLCQDLKDRGPVRLGTGRGLTIKMREEIWANRNSYKGKIARFLWQLVGTKDAPRIPIWNGWRDPDDMS